MTKLPLQRILSLGSIAVLVPLAAWAQDLKNQGYWVDGSGKVVTSQVAGMCWKSGDWTPALAVEPCDPLIRRTVTAVAPVAKPVETAAAPVTPIATTPVTPIKLPPKRLSFSGDALFGFDKTQIQPEGKQMLDELVTQLNGAQYENIVLTGHADRIGNAKYNQKLSEKRATAVKDYLVEKQIPGDRISATGMGAAQPLTSPEDCARLKRPDLVTCLQPDRRVDVEMTGTMGVPENQQTP